MLGGFLELSVWTRDISASAAFYEALGLEHAAVGETWSHRYGVLTDGRLVVGLHEYEFDSPSVTFVRPGVAQAVAELEAAGVTFDFAKTGESEFNEAGFRDPAGQVVTLLEARTFSPPWRETPPGCVAGYFTEYRYPAADPAEVAKFWERLGPVIDRDADPPRVVAAGVTLAPAPGLRSPELVFQASEVGPIAEALQRRGLPAGRAAGGSLTLRTPEGLGIRVEPED
jgi:catechol 2,3-dioxygenase-like lactoylglutathione lyase family enzyme